MMFKKTAAALSFCCALGVAGTATADMFLFSPTGDGLNTVTATSLDWLQGNTVAISGATVANGDIITDLFQANLNSIVNGSTTVFGNGDGGVFLTVVAGFSEQVVTSSIAAGFGTAVFDNTAATQGLSSFFRVCLQSATGNDLTGAGFACTDANAILTGTLTDIVGANVTTNFNNGNVLLDQFGADDWSGQLSVTSSGAANIAVRITSVNTGYFPDLNIGTTIITAITNTSLITPFNQQNPSYCFSSNGTTSSTSGTSTCSAGTFQAFGTLGNVNGLPAGLGGTGENFIFQADANTTITRSVPEPATLALFGFGLAALALVSRRRKWR